MKGHIYCFNTHENPGIIKAGHTQQDVRKRLRGYLGPTKPRAIIFELEVDNSIEAEKMMLELMRQCVSVTQRHDLGNEWFQSSGNFTPEERFNHLRIIGKIVQKASKKSEIKKGSVVEGNVKESVADSVKESIEDSVKVSHNRLVRTTRTLDCVTSTLTGAKHKHTRMEEIKATSLRGLETYFENFDNYVNQNAPAHHDALSLLKSYEESPFCPHPHHLCKFLPFSEKVRVNVTENRYAHYFNAGLTA